MERSGVQGRIGWVRMGVWAAVGLVLSACGNGDAEPDVTLVARTDSAGVEIVESAGPAWTDADRWTVSAEPVFSIGSATGEEDAYLFDRVSGVLLRSDGSVVVANNGTLELRFFDADGRFSQTVGRAGNGPGEFSDVGRLLGYRGDSLLVFDRGTRRVTLFGAEGALGRVISFPNVGASPFATVEGALDDGRFYGLGPVPVSTPVDWEMQAEMGELVRYESDGSAGEVLVELSRADRYFVTYPGNVLSVNNHPLGRDPGLAASGASLYRTEGSRLAVETLRADGTLERIARSSEAPAPVTTAVVDGLKAQWLGDDPGPDHIQDVNEIFDNMEMPEQLPMAARILADPLGYLWVERFRVLNDDPMIWSIFGPEGTYLGDLRLTDGFRLLTISENRVAGVVSDDLGIERVVAFGLNRGG